jgi:RHS repeat-associated protein
MPQALGAPGISLAFAYNSEHQRVKQIAPAATTIYLNPDASGGLFYEKDLKADGSIEHRHFIMAGGQTIAIVKQTGSGTTTTTTTTTVYLHRDSLGSTSAVTNEAGAVIERMAYEPFGKRRAPAGNTDPDNTIAGINTDRGYTNHEHLDELGLIHMNGRIYDPMAARFMSADPLIQAPDNIQSYNRYSYVLNSPFLYTDPTGFSFWTKLRDKVIKPVAAIVAAYYTGGAAYNAYMGSAIANAGGAMAITGAQFAAASQTAALIGGVTGGFVGGAISGGSLQSGLQGALSGGLFAGVGNLGLNGWEQAAAHGMAGGVSSVAAGGKFGQGFMSAGFAEYAGSKMDFNVVGNGIARMVVGGTASVIGGGRFGNGAMTAAYGYLFNECAHTRNCGIGGGYDSSDIPLLKRMANAIGDFISQDGTVQLGVGGQAGAWVIGGAGEVGIAIPTKLDDVCIYAQACAVAGPQIVLSASGAVSLGQGAPSTGIQGSKGVTWFGGAGAFGNVQLTVNSAGQVQGTRGVVRGGVGAGAGAGYVECGQATMCMRK